MGQKHSRAMEILKYLTFINLNAFIWVASIYVARRTGLKSFGGSNGDLSDLLFGAASLALFVLSTFIGIMAVFGLSYIIGEMRKAAEEEAKSIVQPWRAEMQGRVLAAIGFLKGETSVDHDRFLMRDEAGLRDAITLCEQGYSLLEKVEGAAQFMVLNNLIYYCCVYDHRTRSEFIVESARRLLGAGINHDVINIQLTACRAILQFGSDGREKKKAESILLDIKNSTGIPVKERKEAQRHLNDCRKFIPVE